MMYEFDFDPHPKDKKAKELALGKILLTLYKNDMTFKWWVDVGFKNPNPRGIVVLEITDAEEELWI